MMENLARWWEQKFNLPSNHELFQSKTPFELLTDFWADYYWKNPLESHRTEDGKIVFSNTGDPMIDRWEKMLSEDITPDFVAEAFDDKARASLDALRKGKPRQAQAFKDVVDSVQRQEQALKEDSPEYLPNPFKR